MADGFLDQRRQAMEDAFFHTRDRKLLEEFREHLTHMDRRDQLMDASGIHDQSVLDRMLSLNIGPETLAALTLVPLVEVAWADGKMHRQQRAAVVAAAEAEGVQPKDDAHSLLEQWQDEKPAPEILDTWKSCVRALCETLDAEAADALKHDLLDRARTVAKAAGGILGIGNRVTSDERAMLEELEKAFPPTPPELTSRSNAS